MRFDQSELLDASLELSCPHHMPMQGILRLLHMHGEPSRYAAPQMSYEFPPPHEPSPDAGGHQPITPEGSVVHHSSIALPMSALGHQMR
jgi:hypothetical protein